MYQAVQSAKFRRSLKRVSQYRNFDGDELERIIDFLRTNQPLDQRHYDHELKGEYRGIRECHIRNDLLLLYQKKDNVLVLLLVDIGTHASVFGK